MGKKAKPLKIKQYKVPEEKFLVVIKPWGIYNNFNDADFNHIGAWFERMMQEQINNDQEMCRSSQRPSADPKPNTRVKAIYYQRTHSNIIVELPKEVKDVEPFLGRHFYSKIFLNVAPLSEEFADIYEYKYASHGDPARNSFSVNQPAYDKIPDDLPIRKPYPLPSPAPPPPPDIRYARAIPPEVNERIANRLIASVGAPEPQAGPFMIPHSPSSDSPRQLTTSPTCDGKGKAKEIISVPSDQENRFTEYVRPAYLNSMVTVGSKDLPPVDSSAPPLKMDPYDEEEEAKNVLKTSDNDKCVQMFLSSVINGVKKEEIPDAESTYVPSSELLNALGSLPEGLIEPIVGFKAEETEESHQKIKLEPTELCHNLNSSYQPSGDLLAALATLPGSMDSSSLWEKPGLPQKCESLNKRSIQDVLSGTQPESPKRIKRET